MLVNSKSDYSDVPALDYNKITGLRIAMPCKLCNLAAAWMERLTALGMKYHGG